MKLNQGDFGTVSVANSGAKFYFRCRSFVDIQTGKVLAERKQQKALLATQDTSLYKNLKSSGDDARETTPATKTLRLLSAEGTHLPFIRPDVIEIL